MNSKTANAAVIATCRNVLAALACVLGLVAQAAADEDVLLVMFDAPDCEYCAAWDRDVGVIYDKTAEGRRAPLVRRPAFSAPPEHWVLSAPVQFSPTFVLLRQGREIARIDGYLGEDQFWGLLGQALSRLVDGD